MHTAAIHTALFKAGDSLIAFIDCHINSLNEGSVLVVTSKIVALAQNRMAPASSKDTIIRSESDECIKTPWAVLTRHGTEWRINAGVDESNADAHLILLPEDPFRVAKEIATHLKKKHHLKQLGVIVSDTRSSPLRKGTIGRAIGFFGIKPLKSYIGKKDIYGRKSRVTQSNIVDALAAIAVLEMGEGSEQIPLVCIEDAPAAFVSRYPTQDEQELSILPKNDIFSYVFNATSQCLKNSTQKSKRRK